MRNLSNLLTLALALVVLASCSNGGGDSNSGGGNNGGNSSDVSSSSSDVSSSSSSEDNTPQIPVPNNPVLKSAAISDATGLIITDSNGSAQKPQQTKSNGAVQFQASENFDGSFAPNRLYKVTGDGNIEEVELLSDDQDSLRGLLTPTRIVEMGNGWLLLEFESEFQYVTRSQYWDYESQAYLYDYYLQSYGEVRKAYLVNQTTGAAYEAPWASEALVLDDGGDGFVDNGYNDQNGDWIEATDAVFHAWHHGSAGELFPNTPAAHFDENGDMYVVGLVVEETEIDEYNPYVSFARVLKVDTSASGADTITAEVIQQLDLDASVRPDSLVVSGDGELVVYTSYDDNNNSQIRVLNQRDRATYSMNSILGTNEYSATIRGLDGQLYIAIGDTLEGTFTASGDPYSFSVGILGRLLLVADESRPTFEHRFLINGGQELTASWNPDFTATVPTLEQWQNFPTLLAQGNNLEGNDFYNWYDETIVPVRDALDLQGYSWQSLPGNSGSFSHQTAVVAGQQVMIERNYLGAPVSIYHFDFTAGSVRAAVELYEQFSDFVSYAVNSDSVFVFGLDADLSLDRLVRWNPVSDEINSIDIDVDTFDVKRFKVLNNNSVMLEADVLNPYTDGNISLSSGDKILAEASFDGNVTIIDTIEAGEAQIIVMERVTPGDFITVDGSANDWSLDYRIASDSEGDTTNSALGDITHLSHLSDTEYHWMLAELAGSLGETRLVVALSETTAMTVQNSNGAWVIDGASSNLFSTGAVYARGANAVEFKLPAALVSDLALGNSDYPTLRTEVDRLFGESSLTSDVVDASTGTITVVVELTRPVGPTTISIDLGNNYSLTIEDDNWDEYNAESSDGAFAISVIDGDNGDMSMTLAEVGGSYTVDSSVGESIEILIPLSALGVYADGNATLASDSVDSGTEEVTLVLDIPATFGVMSMSGINHDGTGVIEISNRQGNVFDISLVDGDTATDWTVAGGTQSFDDVSGQLTLTVPASALGFGSAPVSINAAIANAEDLSVPTASDTLGASVTSSASLITIPVDDISN